MSAYIEEIMATVKAKNPSDPELHQAVEEIADSLKTATHRHPE